ncbi:hypothetical protein ABK040_000095 [Willaertia magna]
MESIKVNNKKDRIKQICAGIDSFYIVTENGNLFSSGKHTLTNSNSFQLVPQSLFNNEPIESVSDHILGVIVLSKLSFIYIADDSSVKQIDLNRQKVLQMCSVVTKLSNFHFLTEGNRIYSVDRSNYTVCENKLRDIIDTEKSNERELIKYIEENKHNYEIQLFEEYIGLIIVANRKKAFNLIDKKKFTDIIENQENKNMFCDIALKFEDW